MKAMRLHFGGPGAGGPGKRAPVSTLATVFGEDDQMILGICRLKGHLRSH